MRHNISRGWLGRVITITLLAGFVPVSTAACFGSFPITRKVYRWNLGVHGDKWIRWLVFLVISIVPVYAGAAIFDMVFSNSVEFWTGKQPMAMAPGSIRHVFGNKLSSSADLDGFCHAMQEQKRAEHNTSRDCRRQVREDG